MLLSHLLTDKNMLDEDNAVAVLLLWIIFSIVVVSLMLLLHFFSGLSSALALFKISLLLLISVTFVLLTFEDSCGSTFLDLLELREMIAQIDWLEKLPPPLDCISEELKSLI